MSSDLRSPGGQVAVGRDDENVTVAGSAVSFAHRRLAALAPAFSLLAAAAFLLVQPAVGDLWAARARASAAAHGVGLHYWFSWFGGTAPGHYSVLAPYLSRLVAVDWLGAVATFAITPLCYLLVRGSRHPTLSVWLAAVASGVSLWSGRVAFAQGTALALVALLCVRHDRRFLAGAAAAVTALLSPVSGVFLILGLSGAFLHDPKRRVVAGITATSAGTCLLAVAFYFGLPGPEGFVPKQAVFSVLAIAAMLLARPSPAVRTVLIVSLIACPIVAIVPNGMGSNFERFAWLCLPVATAATARARPRIICITTGFALACTLVGSAKDLWVAHKPMSSPAYYTSLIEQLDRTPDLAGYRIEVVPDGTHVGAYALLDHASLARGYETQSDNALNAVLSSPALTARKYQDWLRENAVRYVVIDHTTLSHSPEDRLVRMHTPGYLHPRWSDAHWQLFEVSGARPIVGAPGRVVQATQSTLTIHSPGPATLSIQIRWSRFLRVHPDGTAKARLAPDGKGFTTLTVAHAGAYAITG